MDYGLKPCNRFITGHDESAKSVFYQTSGLTVHEKSNYSVARAFTLSKIPAPLNEDADLRAYLSDHAKGNPCSATERSVTIDGGVNMVVMTMGPGAQTPMHRTVSIDLISVLEGEIELELDSGECKLLQSGDIAVQRATMHRWRNPSTDKPVRIVAVLMSAEAVTLGGKVIQQEYLP